MKIYTAFCLFVLLLLGFFSFYFSYCRDLVENDAHPVFTKQLAAE